MNRRQIINKILHDHIDVNRHEDYTNYKKLITAIEEWHESEVKKLPIHNVSSSLPYTNEEWQEAKRIKEAHNKFMNEIYGNDC